jgi:hypothetical protein
MVYIIGSVMHYSFFGNKQWCSQSSVDAKVMSLARNQWAKLTNLFYYIHTFFDWTWPGILQCRWWWMEMEHLQNVAIYFHLSWFELFFTSFLFIEEYFLLHFNMHATHSNDTKCTLQTEFKKVKRVKESYAYKWSEICIRMKWIDQCLQVKW